MQTVGAPGTLRAAAAMAAAACCPGNSFSPCGATRGQRYTVATATGEASCSGSGKTDTNHKGV